MGTHRYPVDRDGSTCPQTSPVPGASTRYARPRRRAQQRSGAKSWSVGVASPQETTTSTRFLDGPSTPRAPDSEGKSLGVNAPMAAYASSVVRQLCSRSPISLSSAVWRVRASSSFTHAVSFRLASSRAASVCLRLVMSRAMPCTPMALPASVISRVLTSRATVRPSLAMISGSYTIGASSTAWRAIIRRTSSTWAGAARSARLTPTTSSRVYPMIFSPSLLSDVKRPWGSAV